MFCSWLKEFYIADWRFDIGSCLVDGSIKHGLLVCGWSLVDLLAAKGMIGGLIRLLINS